MSRSQRTRLRRSHRGGGRNKALLALMVVVMAIGIAGIAAVGYVVSIAASAPALSSLKERDPGSNSEVLAADGSRLGFIQASELRLPAESDEFPKLLKDATVAIEDRRFYQHDGIDYEGVIRAGVQNLVNQKTVQGGSTITMQLARNLYISSERTYQRKIREAKVAQEIEERALQAVDPRQVPQHGALRHGGRAVGDRRQGRRADLLQQAPRPAVAARGRDARRPAAGAVAVLAAAQPGRRQGAPQRRPARDGALGDDHRADRPEDDAPRPRAGPVDLLHAPPRELLLRLRQGRADQGVRRQDRAPRRPPGAHDGRPQEAAGGARRDRRAARRHRPLLGDRHDQPQERLHRGDGVLGRLRRVEVQPRRPGPPPARARRSR